MTLPPAAEDAIAAALVQDWKKAILVNTAILKINKVDLDALCRLGFAYLKSGQLTSAKRIYQKVLSLDQYNQIATKNLKKLSALKKKDIEPKSDAIMSPMIFLEEPGKTKIVECIHAAPTSVLSTLSAGQEVFLKVKNHGVEIRANNQTYIAALPDDMSYKINKMIAGGNTYQAIIKAIDKKSVKVLLRELTRGKRFASQPSFTSTTSYVSFAKGGSGRESLDMTPTGEDDGDETTVEEPGEL
jgi:tetratricopeptide (TPR) repeat protein